MAKPLGIVAMLTQFTKNSKASVIHHFNQLDSIMKAGNDSIHTLVQKSLT